MQKHLLKSCIHKCLALKLHQIHFNNPWTEERIQEQGNWTDYIREAILGDWVRYMETNNLINGIKENLIRKFIKKHRFTSW